METVALLLVLILCVLVDISGKLSKINKQLGVDDKLIERKSK